MTENEIAAQIVDAAYKIHVKLGPGLLESVYLAVLAYELRKRGLAVATERELPVVYEAVRIEVGFRIDMIVEEKVIVELKSVEKLAPVHGKQLCAGHPPQRFRDARRGRPGRGPSTRLRTSFWPRRIARWW